MAGIKYILQKEVFDSPEEKILSVCNVTKLIKKKKSSYLCIVATTKPQGPQVVNIVQVKQQDKTYKRKRTWMLDEVKLIDGKSESTESHEFDIVLEKQYKWFTANLHERQNFIAVLYKQINRHVKGEKAIFKNVPRSWLSDSSPEKMIKGDSKNDADEHSDESDSYEDFHALTDKEESDLSKLISECDFAISNAELFMEQLSKNLQDLDGANISTILASEKQVDALMEQIETAINEAESVEKRLDEYDEILCHTRDTMEKMGEKNMMIEIANNNNIKLLHELENVISQLDLPHVHQVALTDTDLTTAAGLAAAKAAGKALQNAMNSDIDPALLRLTAVQDQRKRFEKWKAKFSQTISRHLNNMFIHLGNDLNEAQLHAPAHEISLCKHSTVHKELSTYAELMHWTKIMDRKAYDGLTKVYTSSMGKVYDREMRHFFEQARQMITTNKDEMSTSMTSKFKTQPTTKQVAQPYGLLGMNRELWSNGVEASERQKFDSILEKVLAELEPVALSEQMFCIGFFQLDVLSPTGKNTQTTLDSVAADIGKDEKDAVLGAAIVPQKRIDRQINEEVRRMMISLFGVLEPELNNFIVSFEKLDSL